MKRHILIFVLGLSVCLQDCLVDSSDTTMFLTKLTWNDANQYCESIGQNLVTINRKAKNMILQKQISDLIFNDATLPIEFWIGLHSTVVGNPIERKWTTSNCSLPDYVNWSPSVSLNSSEMCAYVIVSSNTLDWYIAQCNSVLKAFLCEIPENSADFCSGHSYETFPLKRGNALRLDEIPPGSATVALCVDLCEKIAKVGFCWGFLFNIIDNRCRTYNVNDDPFYNDIDIVMDNTKDTHIRRCYVTVTINNSAITVPTYDKCGNTVASKCVCSTIDLTTEQAISTTTEQLSTITPMQSSLKLNQQVTTSDYGTTGYIPILTTNVMPSTGTTKQLLSTIITTEALSSSGTTKQPLSTTDVLSSSSTIKQPLSSILTTDVLLSSVTTKQTLSTVGGTYSCDCPCQNATNVKTEEYIAAILNSLKIDKMKTNSAIRRRTCAVDNRTSAVSIGCVGVVVLVTVFGFLISLDFPILKRHLSLFCRRLFKQTMSLRKE